LMSPSKAILTLESLEYTVTVRVVSDEATT
jgi:hypothetical protein